MENTEVWQVENTEVWQVENTEVWQVDNTEVLKPRYRNEVQSTEVRRKAT